MRKRLFQVKITYFKESGKYYTHVEERLELTVCFGSDVPYIYDVCDWVRNRNALHELPGLNSGSWQGPVLIQIGEWAPQLVFL